MLQFFFEQKIYHLLRKKGGCSSLICRSFFQSISVENNSKTDRELYKPNIDCWFRFYIDFKRRQSIRLSLKKPSLTVFGCNSGCGYRLGNALWRRNNNAKSPCLRLLAWETTLAGNHIAKTIRIYYIVPRSIK